MGSDLDQRLKDAAQAADARARDKAGRSRTREESALARVEARRSKQRARLVFVEDGDGWEIRGESLWWHWYAVATIALVTVFFGWVFGGSFGVWGWLLMLPTVGVVGWPAVLFSAATHRYRVMRDGRMAELNARGKVLHVGQRQDLHCRVIGSEDRVVIYAADRSPTDLSPVGHADTQALRSFCDAASVELRVDQVTRDELLELAASTTRTWFLVAALFGVMGIGMLAYSRVSVSDPPILMQREGPLSGTFSASSEVTGEWSLSPEHCVSGRERGFTGIAFLFGASDPVAEIRIDTATDGDNRVIVRYRDPKRAPLNIPERTCTRVDGAITQQQLTFNGRPLLRLEGSIDFACPTHNLNGHAEFSGCLPRD